MAKQTKPDSKPRRLLAYQVETNDPEESNIQFATSNAAARRQGADHIGTDFGAVSCRRAQWADQFADQGFIPAKHYIDAGWWFECNNCGQHCDSEAIRWDEETGEDVKLVLVFDGPTVYCSQDCKEAHDAEVAARNAKFEAFKAAVVQAEPGVTFTEFTGGYPWCANSGRFRFPGCQFGGSVRDTEDSTELTWYVANADQQAWEAFIASKAA